MLNDLGSETRKRYKIFVFPKISNRLRGPILLFSGHQKLLPQR